MNFHKGKHPRSYFSVRKISVVIRFLTLSDILLVSGFGMMLPIFAVYITKSIENGTVEVAGIATAIYLFTKSLAQIPVATLIDKIKGEKDDFWVMFIGTVSFSIIPLLYIFVKTPLALYLVQFIYGLAAAMTFPTWFALFTRHVDRDHEGIEWGVYQTFVDLSGATAATIGGFIAYQFGFTYLFLVVSALIFIGSMFLLGVYNNLKKAQVE